MTKQRTLQVFRGTTTQNNAYTGSTGEVTYDTEEKRLRVHDGSTAGGIKLAKYSEGLPTNGDVVVESSTGTNTWYRKYASGWVEQGGNKLSGTAAYTLPIQMANTNYFINASTDTNFPFSINCVRTSATEINIHTHDLNSNVFNTWTGTWMVIGQAAA